MNTLKTLKFPDKPYFEPEELINDVIVPCFENSNEVKLLSAYFNFDSFLEIAESLETFLIKDGTIKIIVSIPRLFENLDFSNLDPSIVHAYSSRSVDDTYKSFVDSLKSQSGLLKSELEKNKVALISHLVKNEIVDIKFSIRDEGFDHSKIFIFQENDNAVVLSSTMNWTLSGLTLQSNETNIYTSETASNYLSHYLDRFEDIWNNKLQYLKSYKFETNLADSLLKEVGNPKYEDIKKYFFDLPSNKVYQEIKSSPLYFEYNLGNSALLPHQVHAVNKCLDSWPIRHLFADEVGLGKTLEVGSTVAYLNIIKHLNKVVILAPQSVVNQWQTEMKHHFGLDFFILSKDKKFWIDLNGNEIERKDKSLIYNLDFPNKVIISKDLARGTKGQHIFKHSKQFPDILVVDEAHHARASKKTNTFKQTLLRELILDCNKNIEHIIFATATPMRTHPDEYYYLLDLLGVGKFLSEFIYTDFLNSLTTESDGWNVEEIVTVFSTIKPIAEKLSYFSKSIFTDKEISLLNKIINSERDNLDLEYFKLQSKTLYELGIKFNPLSMFTSKSSRDVLERYPDTYNFPIRKFVSSPITEENIYLEFELFFKDLMKYADEDYLSSEQAMGVVMQNTSFAKAGFKESFVSSFWSARERLVNRKKIVEQYIERTEKGNLKDLLDEKNIIDEFYDVDDLETEGNEFEVKDIKDTSLLPNVLNACKKEREQLKALIQYSDALIEEKAEPDPKIEHLKILLKELLQEKRPTLVFAHYIATLDNAYESVMSEFSQKINGVGMYKGGEIWYEISGNRYKSNKKQIKKLLHSGEIQILFCSEAASEGINLQAADKLINLDVPWVPSVLEQRIGRIARFGQESKEVRIFNLWYPNSYEADIYKTLMERVDLLKLAMGPFPNIVSKRIKSEVSDINHSVSAMINELNEKKAETEYVGLSQLWDYDNENHQTFGNSFRERLLHVISKAGISTDEYTNKAGEENVVTFKSKILKEFMEKMKVSSKGNFVLYKLFSNKKLYGFVVNKEETDFYYLISPRNLPEILDAIYFDDVPELNYIQELDLNNKKLVNIISIYKNKLQEWFIPDHNYFTKDTEDYDTDINDYTLERFSNINIKLKSSNK